MNSADTKSQSGETFRNVLRHVTERALTSAGSVTLSGFAQIEHCFTAQASSRRRRYAQYLSRIPSRAELFVPTWNTLDNLANSHA